MSKSRAAGWASDSPTPAQLKELFAQIDSGKVTRDRLQDFLRGTPSKAPDEPIYPLTIDYNLSIEDMVKAGNYNSVHRKIKAKNFPAGRGEAKVEAVLFRSGNMVITQEVLAELERHNLRPATMVELLAFGKQHPDPLRVFPIVALGSVWFDGEGDGNVGNLYETPSGRTLSLSLYENTAQLPDWGTHNRFLAIRKSA